MSDGPELPRGNALWNNDRIRNLAIVSGCVLVVGYSIGVLRYLPFLKVNLSWHLLPVYHTAFSIALLIGLAGLYYHASKFYADSFYLFLSLGWLSNLGYILFINSSIGREDEAGLRFRSSTLLLAILSGLPLYLASRTKSRKPPTYSDLWLPLSVVLIWTIGTVFVADASTNIRFHVLLAMTFATYVGIQLYRAFRLRVAEAQLEFLESSVGTYKRSIFPNKLLLYDFLALAVLQVSFSFILFDQTRAALTYILYIALFVKIVNAYALTIMLREDYATIRARAERNEEQLRQERQERNELQEIGLLTASIEHELRTPLGVLNSKLSDMSRTYQHLPNVVEDVEYLQSQRERLLNATKIITVLRAGQDFFKKKQAAVNLTDLTHLAIRDLKKEMDLSNIFFKHEEQVGNPVGYAHAQLLTQAIINILKNAVEAIRSSKSKTGEVVITIARSKDSNRFLLMEFRDNGPGFPEGSLDKLTQPDYSTKAEEKPNRGLGLFVSERIIKLHKGTLRFANADGGGAIVSITVPRAASQTKVSGEHVLKKEGSASI